MTACYCGYLLPDRPAVGDRHTLNCRGQSLRRASCLDGPARRRDSLVNDKAIVRIERDGESACRRRPWSGINNTWRQGHETRRVSKLNRVDIIANHVSGIAVVRLNAVLPSWRSGAIGVLSH